MYVCIKYNDIRIFHAATYAFTKCNVQALFSDRSANISKETYAKKPPLYKYRAEKVENNRKYS